MLPPPNSCCCLSFVMSELKSIIWNNFSLIAPHYFDWEHWMDRSCQLVTTGFRPDQQKSLFYSLNLQFITVHHIIRLSYCVFWTNVLINLVDKILSKFKSKFFSFDNTLAETSCFIHRTDKLYYAHDSSGKRCRVNCSVVASCTLSLITLPLMFLTHNTISALSAWSHHTAHGQHSNILSHSLCYQNASFFPLFALCVSFNDVCIQLFSCNFSCKCHRGRNVRWRSRKSEGVLTWRCLGWW